MTVWAEVLIEVRSLHSNGMPRHCFSTQNTGAAFVAARVGTCCFPNGVFFSISLDQQAWALTNNIDVENPTSKLASNEYFVVSNSWYNLTLSVDGMIVNAWIDQNQVSIHAHLFKTLRDFVVLLRISIC